MNERISADTDIVGAISERFRNLIRNLLQGNMKRARSLADQVQSEAQESGEQIALQNFIEDMAQGQAIRNAFINLPSAVPGIGTILSWGLISIEDFFTLDQSVTLILALCMLRGFDPRDRREMEEFAILSVGEAYGLGPDESDRDSGKVLKGMMTRLLPQKYVNRGMNRWVKAFVRRILPFRRKSRLLPVGFGIAMSAWDAYDTLVKVGRITLREIAARQKREPVR